MTYLAITVLATVVLYYELYVQGSVVDEDHPHYGISFTQFVLVLVVGNAVGAFASLFAGLADRWGRANLVVGRPRYHRVADRVRTPQRLQQGRVHRRSSRC